MNVEKTITTPSENPDWAAPNGAESARARNPSDHVESSQELSSDPSAWDIEPLGEQVISRWMSVVVTARGRRIIVAKIQND